MQKPANKLHNMMHFNIYGAHTYLSMMQKLLFSYQGALHLFLTVIPPRNLSCYIPTRSSG